MTMQCNMTQLYNSNGVTGHYDIRTKAQLQQGKGTVVMTRPIAKLKMNLCPPGLDVQTMLGALLTMQPRMRSQMTPLGLSLWKRLAQKENCLCSGSFDSKCYIRLKTGLRIVKSLDRCEKSPYLHCTCF